MAPKYPSIPEPTLDPQSLRDAVLTLKQAFEVLTGQRGNPDYRAVLLPELVASDNADDAAIAANAAAIAANTTNIAANTASVTAHEAAWTAYTPVITTNTGAFTTVSATGKYKVIGKTVFVSIVISIPTVGTGQYPIASLPFAAAASTYFLPGREGAVTGAMMNGFISPSASTVFVVKYDNNSPSVNGASISVSGVYERA
jgi:hypothetical protein